MIKVKKLTKKFKDFVAVDNISFSVEKGEFFALLGPNGAGKSTIIKMLTTLLDPTSGEIEVNGHDAFKDQSNVRKSFGVIFQDPSLDDELTALENMYFHAVLYDVSKDLRESRTEELLKIVELWDRRKDFVKTFSGGMKRRLEIARGLLHHPDILFLDEPTLGLDPQTRNKIWNYIFDLNKKQGITVFFTTHYMDEVERVAGQVVVIDHGKIIRKGSPDELKQLTNSKTLEEAFLSLTGRDIRDESADGTEQLRMRKKIMRR